MLRPVHQPAFVLDIAAVGVDLTLQFLGERLPKTPSHLVPGVDRVVLRTSGLLSRSNKVMYDLTTRSMFDTFTGRALTGPLGASGVHLEQVSVVASPRGDWKRAHPAAPPRTRSEAGMTSSPSSR